MRRQLGLAAGILGLKPWQGMVVGVFLGAGLALLAVSIKSAVALVSAGRFIPYLADAPDGVPVDSAYTP